MSGFEVGSTFATLGVDLGGFQKGLDQGKRDATDFAEGVEKRVEKTSSSFTKMGSLVAGLFGGIGFKAAEIGFDLVGRGASSAFDLITGGMDDARGAGLLLAQTENVIEGMGNVAGRSAVEVNDFASSLSDAAGMSLFGDDMIVESTNLLLTFGNLKGETLDLATAMSVDMAQSLGGAPVDSAIQLGKALNDPIKGVTALSRVGVSFSEDQKKVIARLVETGDVAGAQKVILDELGRQFGGSAAAAAKAAGPMVRIRGILGEAAETIGGALLPVLDRFTGWLGSEAVMTGISTFANNLAGGITRAADFIDTGVTRITGIVGHVQSAFTDGGITAAIDTLLFDIGKIIPATEPVTSFLRGMLPQAVSLVTTAFNLARDGITTFIAAYNGEWQNNDKILLIHQGFGLLGQAIGIVRDGMLTFVAAYNGDWQNSDRVLLIHQAFGLLGGFIGQTLVPAIQSLVLWFQQNWDMVTKVGAAVGVAVVAFQTLSAIVGTVAGVIGTVTAAWIGASTAVTAAGGVLATIVGILGGPVTIAIGAVALAVGALYLAWQTNFGGIQEKTAAVVDWWTGTAQPAIGRGFEAVKQTLSDMRAAWDRDFEMVRGFITTLQTAWDTTVAAVGVAIELAKSYISGFRDTVETKVNEAVTFFTELPGRITGALSGLAADLLSIGASAIQGLIDGLKSIDVGSILGGILRAGIDAAKSAIQSNSPSKLTRDQLGKPMGEGIVLGINSTAESVKQALGKTVTGAVTAIQDLLRTGDFRGGIGGLMEDDPFLTFLFKVREDTKATAAVLDLLKTGDFKGGILGLNEDHAFIAFLLAAREGVKDFSKVDLSNLDTSLRDIAGIDFSDLDTDLYELGETLTEKLPPEARKGGVATATEFLGGYDSIAPMEQIRKGIKSMFGYVIPADAIPFAGELGSNLGATIAAEATKKLKTELGKGIPGAIADVSKALRSDKNRSDEAKPNKGGVNLGAGVGMGSLDGLTDTATAVLRVAPEIAGSQGEFTALAFTTTYQETMIRLLPDSTTAMVEFLANIRSDAIRPGMLAMGTQMYLGGQTAVSMLGNALDEGTGGFEAKGRAAGEAYARGFNSALGAMHASQGSQGGFFDLGGELRSRGVR